MKKLLLISLLLFFIGCSKPTEYVKAEIVKIQTIGHLSRFHYKVIKYPLYTGYINRNPRKILWQVGDIVLIEIFVSELKRVKNVE